MFKKAIKQELKLRMALMGPPGSGKSYTALSIASHLGGPIAAIDTEHGSLSKYADSFNFDVCELESFHPDRYTEAIQEAAASGYKVIVIDSMSHAWSGKDGLLEELDKIGKRKQSANSFQNWKDANPILNRMIESILASDCHIISTFRTKVEWVVELNDKGRSVPRKVGLAPVFKDQVEFEFDIVGEMNQENELVISKSRCPQLSGEVILRPGKGVAKILLQWLGSATADVPIAEPARASKPSAEQLAELKKRVTSSPWFQAAYWLGLLESWYGIKTAADLTIEQYQGLVDELDSGVDWFANLEILPQQIKRIQTLAHSDPNYSDSAWAALKVELGFKSTKDLSRGKAQEIIDKMLASQRLGSSLFPEKEEVTDVDEVQASEVSESSESVDGEEVELQDYPIWSEFQELIKGAESLEELETMRAMASEYAEWWLRSGDLPSTETLSSLMASRRFQLFERKVSGDFGDCPGDSKIVLCDFLERLYRAESQASIGATRKWIKAKARWSKLESELGSNLTPWVEMQFEAASDRVDRRKDQG